MRTHRHNSHCEFHLGDNLIHLHFLRKLALSNPGHEFFHAVEPCHADQLLPVIADIPTVHLAAHELGRGDVPADSRHVWKNAGGFWQNHPLRNDWSGFYLEWFRHLSDEMGLVNPMIRPANLLFDYPKLLEPCFADEFDFLVVNSQPCSGQLRVFDRIEYMDPLIERLAAKGHRVLVTQKTGVPGVKCTADWKMSLTEIGHLSIFIPHHVMISTGPSWTTFNVWQWPPSGPQRHRIVLLENEQLNLPGIRQVSRLEEVYPILEQSQLL